MIWLAPANTTIAPSRPPPRRPPRPRARVLPTDPRPTDPSAAASAPASIAPSSPRLITPARSVTVSPSAASRSGVATRTAAARNPAIAAASSASVIGPEPPRPAAGARSGGAPRRRIGQEHRDDHRRLHHIDEDRRNPRLALHGPRAGLQRAEQDAGGEYPQRLEPSEQRDRDPGEPVAGREILKERVRHAPDLHAAGEPGERARSEQRDAVTRRTGTRPLTSAARGPAPRRDQREPPPRPAHQVRERERQDHRNAESEVEPGSRQNGQSRRRGDRIALG